MAARCGGSRLQNGGGSRKDAGRALIENFLFGFQPVLYVATAELRTFKAKRLAANECDGLGLDLADMSRGLFAVHESVGRCVSENNVSDLVERRLCGRAARGFTAISRPFAKP